MPGRKVRLFLSAYCIVEAQPGLQRNRFYILKRPIIIFLKRIGSGFSIRGEEW